MAATGNTASCQTQEQLVCEENPHSSVYPPIDASKVYTSLTGESATTSVPGETVDGVVGGRCACANVENPPSIDRPIDTSEVYTSPTAKMAVPGEIAGVVVDRGAPCCYASAHEAYCASSAHVNLASKPLSVAGTEAVDTIRTSQETAVEVTNSSESSETLVREVEAAKKNACAAIQKAFDELHKVMEERRRELLEGMEGVSDAKKAALAHRNKELKSLRSEMTEYCEVATYTLEAHREEEEVAPLWDLLAAEMRSVQDRMEALPPLLITPDITTAVIDPTHVVQQILKLGASDK